MTAHFISVAIVEHQCASFSALRVWTEQHLDSEAHGSVEHDNCRRTHEHGRGGGKWRPIHAFVPGQDPVDPYDCQGRCGQLVCCRAWRCRSLRRGKTRQRDASPFASHGDKGAWLHSINTHTCQHTPSIPLSCLLVFRSLHTHPHISPFRWALAAAAHAIIARERITRFPQSQTKPHRYELVGRTRSGRESCRIKI